MYTTHPARPPPCGDAWAARPPPPAQPPPPPFLSPCSPAVGRERPRRRAPAAAPHLSGRCVVPLRARFCIPGRPLCRHYLGPLPCGVLRASLLGGPPRGAPPAGPSFGVACALCLGCRASRFVRVWSTGSARWRRCMALLALLNPRPPPARPALRPRGGACTPHTHTCCGAQPIPPPPLRRVVAIIAQLPPQPQDTL
ncbi:MAG: hypothetical protein J3K34DRAFT_403185, partial [Monoraphidium minutum]